MAKAKKDNTDAAGVELKVNGITYKDESEGNLRLWDELAPVNAEFIQQYKTSTTLTCVHPQWRLRRMTEVFGPVGEGWGYEIVERWAEFDCAFVRLKVWYIHELCMNALTPSPPRWTGEQIGGTTATRNPDDSYKSAVTDALGKCVSQIGLAATVYMGQAASEFVEGMAADQMEELMELIEATGTDPARLLHHNKVASFSEMKLSTANANIRTLKRKLENQGAASNEDS